MKKKFRVWCDDTKSYAGPWELGDKALEFYVNNYPEGVEQFTGITDRSGKDVYENDVIISEYAKNCPLAIIYGNEADGLGYYLGTYDLVKEKIVPIEIFGLDHNLDTSYFHIVGNVHTKMFDLIDYARKEQNKKSKKKENNNERQTAFSQNSKE